MRIHEVGQHIVRAAQRRRPVGPILNLSDRQSPRSVQHQADAAQGRQQRCIHHATVLNPDDGELPFPTGELIEPRLGVGEVHQGIQFDTAPRAVGRHIDRPFACVATRRVHDLRHATEIDHAARQRLNQNLIVVGQTVRHACQVVKVQNTARPRCLERHSVQCVA